MFFVNLFREGAVFETEAQGDASQPVKVDEDAAKTLTAILELESFQIAHMLAQVYLAGVTAGERAVRGFNSAASAVAKATRGVPVAQDRASTRTHGASPTGSAQSPDEPGDG